VSDPVAIAAFAGSLRKKSLNRGLVRAAVEVAPEDVTIRVLELHDLPFYDADHDGPASPPAVVAFRNAIASADALLIATPEYNYSISGVLKNAIDWASRKPSQEEPPALQGKPAAIMGAGGRFGTVRAQAHLRYILLHNDVKVLNKPEIMIPRAWEHFDADGNLADDGLRGQVAELVAALAAWTRLLRKG
jgi:chromate reductase